jgi:hypothetical protein
MIVADKKPIEEIIEEIKEYRSILVLGCNECVTVCEAGGKKRSRRSGFHSADVLPAAG